RPAARAWRASRRDAEHRGRPAGRAGAAAGRGDGSAHRGRRARHPRRSGAAGRHPRGAARGASRPRPWRGRPPRGGGRRRAAGGGGAMSTYRRMLRYLAPLIWPYGVFAIVFMLAFSAIESSVPFLIKFIIDQLGSQQRDMLPRLAGLALGLSLLRGGVGFVAG